MKFAAAISTADEGAAAAHELVEQVRERVPAPDLAVLLLTSPLADAAEAMRAAVREALAPEVILGCTAEGVIGGDQELERRPGASLLVGQLPGVTLRPFHLAVDRWHELFASDELLQQAVGTGAAHRGQLLVGDPYTTPVNDLLSALNRVFPGLPTLGGMASGAGQLGDNALILDDALFHEGAVGVGLGGALRLEAVVSQGCRPIGRPLVVTRADRNQIEELGRRPALEVVQELLGELPDEDRALVQNGSLFIGLVINEYQDQFQRGDFLVRNLLGIARDSSALVVGDLVRPGQSIQFHVRDADTATEDLQALLAPHEQESPGPAGGILFSCNGRGTRMFPEPNHDAGAIRRQLPGLPLAGFFAAGELGPIGGQSFLHGHTASLALFRPE
jgi:small ligand-binding sensory domain FIST